MQKQEFLEVFEAASQAAKAARGGESSTAVSRCLDAMKHLKKTPESLVCDLLSYLYATGRKQNQPVVVKKKRVEISKTGDSKRDKVVAETEMKKRVVSCDLWTVAVAVSVESAMFEKLGCFEGSQKAKYRSILFNMGDSNNPDLLFL
ncbi:hypothetical protein EUTSA_v10019665mg, partial [Eutrema salsugineum]